MNRKIYVTQPFLPPLKEYVRYLKEIWKSGVLTNNGIMEQTLEKELTNFLKVKHLISVTNGTMALQLAIRALNLKGEIITTPFTFIATVSSIIWEGCKPVFIDIDADTLNIDVDKIEDRISDRTCAILGVHVFSNPCNVEKIMAIAQKYKLAVIYDAAHAFSVNYGGKSLMSYGDISTMSFHATKLFNTIEGGACVCNDEILANRIEKFRFFGFNEDKEITDYGTNSKLTEVHAAMGVASLKYIDEIIEKRKHKYQLYLELLSQTRKIKYQKISPDSYNYSYMPIIFDSEDELINVEFILNRNDCYPRRYFYPSLNTVKCLNMDRECLPVAESISKRILCLPLYYQLEDDEIYRICKFIKQGL